MATLSLKPACQAQGWFLSSGHISQEEVHTKFTLMKADGAGRSARGETTPKILSTHREQSCFLHIPPQLTMGCLGALLLQENPESLFSPRTLHRALLPVPDSFFSMISTTWPTLRLISELSCFW